MEKKKIEIAVEGYVETIQGWLFEDGRIEMDKIKFNNGLNIERAEMDIPPGLDTIEKVIRYLTGHPVIPFNCG